MNKKNALSFKKPSILNKDSILTFGQYKNESIGDVMKYDASYLIWLVENKVIDLDVDLYDEVVELADSEERDRYDTWNSDYNDYETDSFSIY